jgi:hypothetical protein
MYINEQPLFFYLKELTMALCIRKSMITDERAEIEGVWQDYENGSRVLLARFDNEEAQKIRVEEYRENRAVIDQGGELADTISLRAEIKAMSQAVVRGWEGFVDEDGNEDVYTPAKAAEYLELSKDFRRDMQRMSMGRERYLAQNLAADAKKVKK